MKIPIGIFFGGRTPARDQSLRNAQRVFAELNKGIFEAIPIFVDPFGQLILLGKEMPKAASVSTFYPGNQYFSKAERSQFPVYPEQLGQLGDKEKRAMAETLGELHSVESLSEKISIAFLTMPDVSVLQAALTAQRIPFTGENQVLLDLLADRYSFRLELQRQDFPMPADHRLARKDWQKSNLQALENSASIAFPFLIQPSHQYQAGRSSVITSKDGPTGLKRAIDLAYGQKRLPSEDWLDMSPVDRENFVRKLGEWSSGIAFPLELDTGKETIVFQRPQALLDFLSQTASGNDKATYIFRSQRAEDEILVSSLPEGTALSCLLLRRSDGSWEAEQLRYLGPARSIVVGTEQLPMNQQEPVFRISESMSQQVINSCIQLAEQLSASSGLRIYGILTSDGQLVPEEVQGFTGPNNEEDISYEALKSFMIASLQARQAEQPEPAYRTLMETISSASATDAITREKSAISEVVKPVAAMSTTKERTAGSGKQDLYERELQKLNQEKEVVPNNTASNDRESAGASPVAESKVKKIWENTTAFFSSRIFLRNIGAAAVFILLLFLLVNMGLRAYTKHGNSMQLENYQGLLLEDAERKATAKGLKLEVISRPFVLGKRPNEIFSQYPPPLSKVKENRTIFVSVYGGEGKEITLPTFTESGDNIADYSRELRKNKIRLLVKDEKFDAKLEEGTILYLLIDGEKITNTELRQGKAKVKEGEVVDAVVSTRNSNIVQIPPLVCRTFEQAQFYITNVNLVVGKVYGGSDGNRNNYYVWKQEPQHQPGKMITKGEAINLYLIPTRPDGCSGE